MLRQTSLLVSLVLLMDHLPWPPVPGKRPRGRPKMYSDRLMMKALVIMIIRRLYSPDYSQPQKSTTESACDVRITPAQSHHRISWLLKQAHQVVLALHQSAALLPTSTRQPHSPLGLPTSTWHLSRRRSRWRSQSLRGGRTAVNKVKLHVLMAHQERPIYAFHW
jgi:hypothetical protein